MATYGRVIGTALCELFGMNPNEVYALEMKIPCDGAVAVVIERRFPDVETNDVRQVFEHYHLEPGEAET